MRECSRANGESGGKKMKCASFSRRFVFLSDAAVRYDIHISIIAHFIQTHPALNFLRQCTSSIHVKFCLGFLFESFMFCIRTRIKKNWMRGRTSPSLSSQKLHKERETIIVCAFSNVFRWKRLNSYDKSNINGKIWCTFWALNPVLGKRGVRNDALSTVKR